MKLTKTSIYRFAATGLSICVFAIFLKGSLYHDVASKALTSKIIFIEDSWDEALKQAAKQHKYIFADAYASWCGPCKLLKETTFSDHKVADFFNVNFINVSIDMEKGEGPVLAEKWQIRAYPTMIVFDPAGKPVFGTVGYLNANQLISFGKQVLKKK